MSPITDSHVERINGSWIGEGHQQRGPSGYPIDFGIALNLVAANELVTGEMKLEMPYQGKQYKSEFALTGGFVGGRFVWVNYVGNRGHRPHFGSIVWDLSSDDQKLIGEYTGYGALTDGVVSGYARLTRVR
jgi:hypothetical protein